MFHKSMWRRTEALLSAPSTTKLSDCDKHSINIKRQSHFNMDSDMKEYNSKMIYIDYRHINDLMYVHIDKKKSRLYINYNVMA